MKNKRRFNLAYFAQQTGAVVTTAIMVVGLGLTLWGISSMRQQAEKAKARQIDVTSEEVTGQERRMDKIDPVEAKKSNNANVLKTGVEGGKTVIGTAAPVHDSLVLTAYEKTVGFTVKQDKDEKSNTDEEERDKKVEDDLKEKGLPSDKLSRDVAKRIEDVAVENSPSEAEGDVLESIEEVVDKNTEEVLRRGGKDKITGDDGEIKRSIKRDLNKEDVLEDQRIIEQKKQLELARQDKQMMEKMSSAYYEYAKQGLIFPDKEKYDEFNKQIAEKEENIAAMQDELISDQESISTIKVSAEGDEQETDIAEEAEIIDISEEDPAEDVEDQIGTEEEPGTDQSETEATQEEEQAKGSVTLSGGIAAGKGTVTMTINLDNGNISGSFTYRDKVQDCDVRVAASIYGSMDLETGKIRASVSGTAYYSGEEDYCNTTESFTDSLNGTLSQDNSSASGTCAHGESWYID